MPEGYRSCCRDCYFAQYEGKTQTGCALGRLEKFKENGANIVEATDNNKNFYLIEGRLCSALRPKDWADHTNDPVGSVLRELELDIEVFVYTDGKTTEKQLMDTLISIRNSELKVGKITVIDNFSKLNYPALVSYFKDERLKTWKIDKVADQVPDFESALDVSVLGKKINSIYIYAIKAGTILDPNYLKDLNKEINIDLQRFAVDITPNEGLFTLTNLYKNVYGNTGQKYLLKVLELAAEQETGILVRKTTCKSQN